MQIRPSTRIQNVVRFNNFHSEERIKKFPDLLANSAVCVWTIAVSGNKRFRTEKYPDTRGRGLKSVANPLCSCLSCSFNIPSLVLGNRLCFRASSRCIESYLARIWEGLSCSRIFLRLHILVIPLSNLVKNEYYAFTGNRGGVFIRVFIRMVFSYIWIFCLGKTHREVGVFFFF